MSFNINFDQGPSTTQTNVPPLTESENQKLKDLNALDFEFYDFAKDLFLKRVKTMEQKLQTKFRKRYPNLFKGGGHSDIFEHHQNGGQTKTKQMNSEENNDDDSATTTENDSNDDEEDDKWKQKNKRSQQPGEISL